MTEVSAEKKKKKSFKIFTILNRANRILGKPMFMNDTKYALNEANMSENSHHTFTFTFTNTSEGDEFAQRLKRITGDERTHGIDIQQQTIPIPTAKTKFNATSRTPNQLEMNVWDFAGQHSYYHNHHYFLSARSVFLVVWNVLETQKGVDGLEFWLKSLKAHLPALTTTVSTSASTPQQQLQYSIIVVGTHIDGLVGAEKMKYVREKRLCEMFQVKCEMGAVPFKYVEVSS